MSFSNAEENTVLDAAFTRWTANPPNVYVALWVGNPTDDASGGAELAYTGYAAVQHDNWKAAVNGIVANQGGIVFPTPGNGGMQATHVALFNSLTLRAASNLLAWGTLSPAQEIIQGNPPQFADGALFFNLD